ncbi:hyaluronan mediated motility receptor [Brachyistius frenatus]|uniref:hyaluronan mediated motility receptor n=1 Tax=Brachyistius frenatus TaxID=100188 RepID=UPI0037E99C59
MSFSRAPLKRFNEHAGCAPPPGSYEIKPDDLRGAASFDRSDRFRPVKAAAGTAMPPPSPSRGVLVSPVRRSLSVDGLAGGSSVKKERNGMTVERKQQKLLENEIRSLVQQRGDQGRRLLALEEELNKVEAKLLAAVREKTGLAANVTTLERQRAELKKVNEFLKNKVSADTTKKRINSLTMELMEARNNLDVKNKELSILQVNSEGQLKVLETDLQAARVTVTALKDRNKDLEELHQVIKTQNEELGSENARLHAVIRELREEIKVLQEYLDAANDQIQDLRLKIQEKMEENTAAGVQVEKIKQLETELEQHTSALEKKEEEAHKFQQELQASKDALWEMEKKLEDQELELYSLQKSASDMKEQMKLANQEVQNSQAMVCQQEAELVRLKEVLRRTEKELDERVAHLEQRCLFSEEERSKTQEEGLRRVEELRVELNSLKETKREEKMRQIQLREEHATLTEELTKEKALVDSLSVLVEQEREESEQRLRQLKEEMEEVLGELAVMEEEELRRQEVAEESQEAVQRLQEENKELERQLSETMALLERKSNDVTALKEEHLAAVRELQEACTNSLSKMGDIVTELESTKEALKGAEGRRSNLEAKVDIVTQQIKEEMDKLVEQKEDEIRRVREELEEHQGRQLAEAKAREENSRVLLEAQTLLAQKDEELKGTEAGHAAQISQLQQELQLQTKEKEKALGLLEEQTGPILARLQDEREKAQKLLEEVNQEIKEIMEQLQQEREERVKIQTALQEEKGVLEAERKDHQQVRSEVISLKAELEREDEKRKSLLSQVELKDQSRSALESQLSTAEQDRNVLQSRLNELEQEGASFQAQLDLVEEKTRALQQQLEEHRQDKGAVKEQVEVLTQEKVTLQWEMEEQRRELQRQINEAQENSSPRSETELWRKQYEELFAKVRPFQEQLNAFAAERNVLLNENGANQEELNKLADAYARLLGHQNQKQKIKHVTKLKDENISLRQEVSKLRSQVSRQKSDLEQLKSKLPGTPRRRFDPRKAFQHDKENRQTETTEPLKEGNHYF